VQGRGKISGGKRLSEAEEFFLLPVFALAWNHLWKARTSWGLIGQQCRIRTDSLALVPSFFTGYRPM